MARHRSTRSLRSAGEISGTKSWRAQIESRQAEGHEHIGGVARWRATIGDEAVRTFRRRAARRTGNRQHAHAAFDGLVGRDERTTAHPRLDDDDRIGQRGEDAIPGRKAVRARRTTGRHLGKHQPDATDLPPEIVMFMGVHDVEPAGHDADG